MRDGRRERHRAPWHATCRGQRVSPLSPARPAAAHAGGAATSRGTHWRCAPRGDIRRLKNNDAATSITRGQVLALRIKLDRADQVLCAGGARRRVVTGPCSPCAAPPLASAQASHPAPLWHPLRPTSRLIMAIRGCGAPSAGSSVESFSPKTCLNRQFAFAIDGAACTAKHRCSERMTARAHHGRQRPRHTSSYRAGIAPDHRCSTRDMPSSARLQSSASGMQVLRRYTFGEAACGTFCRTSPAERWLVAAHPARPAGSHIVAPLRVWRRCR